MMTGRTAKPEERRTLKRPSVLVDDYPRRKRAWLFAAKRGMTVYVALISEVMPDQDSILDYRND